MDSHAWIVLRTCTSHHRNDARLGMRHFHHREFSDTFALLALKGSHRISVCLPTLNEARTLGTILDCLRKNLIENVPLIDEIWVVDSGSSDDTLHIAKEHGAHAVLAEEVFPSAEKYTGKGENLWKALQVAKGDLIVYLDADLIDFGPHFVLGLLGPLLTDPTIDYVKSFYQRPLALGNGVAPDAGGRVSEILIRPLLALFYPALTAIQQPLAGEYAARRELLENLAYPTGYGVEIAHLIDLYQNGKFNSLAQVDLDCRTHRNRDDVALGQMTFALMQVIFRRLERDGKLSLHEPLLEIYQTWRIDGKRAIKQSMLLDEPERPPIRSLQSMLNP
ncbi:MAG: glucosyl-3-phosphoglycerate synthase [Verrucomicrobia bacterium]|nr:MAG: glucosyl-3-phosphoglycerate synthase [Verrucomicrobiota bacterium]